MKKIGLIILLLHLCIQSSYCQFWSKRDFALTMNYDVMCGSGTTSFRLLALVPATHPGVQEIYILL